MCGYNPEAAETICRLKDMGYRIALATNPIFPAQATEWRIINKEEKDISSYPQGTFIDLLKYIEKVNGSR